MKPSIDEHRRLLEFLYTYNFMGTETKRKVGFFKEDPNDNLSYKYAGKRHEGKPFTPWLHKLAYSLRQQFPDAIFNCANVNFYPKGTRGNLTRHQDDEPCHVNDKIHSISFGANNSMMFYNGPKGQFTRKIRIKNGDYLQFNRMLWHAIGTSKNLQEQWRLNITFRMFK